MAVVANRKIVLTYTGDVEGSSVLEASTNADSPCAVQTHTISAGGTTTFACPANVLVPTAVTIEKPEDYAGTLILKGSSGADDAEGISLHPNDPDSISLAPGQTTIVLKASASCAIRAIWT